ncbi:hypothetical protein EVJ58_g4138 [Rhodofomes roseus]|uniref:Uncharacterized protein n=1 Tax=Rhodofomes roseus TaxID=34475 RepID=A0A4Y9YJY1_9APHY|nr:hypothetical protein EVJ58_g4138 [Rhodofomes roseus]
MYVTGIMRASTIVLILISPINVILNVFFVHYTPLGLLGSPAAISVTLTLCFLFLGIFAYFSPAHRANNTWVTANITTVLNARSCIQFLSLAIPGILMVGTEWAAFEIVALAAGHLGPLPLAAQSVIMTADQVLNNIPFGIVLLACRNVFGYVFSEDEEVIRRIWDCLAGSCGGVLRGLGRQHLGAMFNLIAYYVLALPMGIALAFLPQMQLGLQGLWIGQVVALTIIALGEYAFIWLAIDWEREVHLCIEQNEAEAKRLRLHDDHADQIN